MAIRRIGQILVDLGFIAEEQRELLLDEQRRRPGELLGKLAESMGLISDEQLAQALAEQMAMKVIALGDLNVPMNVIQLVTEPMAALQSHPHRFQGRHADHRHERAAKAHHSG